MPTVTIPTHHTINRTSGTLVLRVAHIENKSTKEVLLTLGDFALAYENGFVTLESPTQTLSVPIVLFPGETEILWTWIENNHRLLITDMDDEWQMSEDTHDLNQMSGQFGDVIRLSNTPAFTGHYQSLIIYAKDYLHGENSVFRKERFLEQADLLFHADYTQPMHYKTEPVVETTFAPEDGSPILVSDEDGLLKRQFFFDYTTGKYTPDNTESFVYRGENKIQLAYTGLNPQFKTLLTFESGDTYIVKHVDTSMFMDVDTLTDKVLQNHLEYEKEYVAMDDDGPFGYALIHGDTIHLNFSEEEKADYYGQAMSVTYQLNRSYNVEYNEQTAHDSLRINLNHHQNHPIEVLQEGNRFSNQKLAREIDLNPLVNPRHTGFLYIDTEEQITQAFRLNISQAYVIADGMDTADFIVEAIDEEGNEVLSPYLDVFLMDDRGRRTDELGMLSPVVHYDTLKARNMSGRCYYQYHAPLVTTDDYPLTQKVYVVALDRRTGIGTQVTLFVRPTTQAPTYRTQPLRVPPAAALVFEYIARYLDRQLEADHPLRQIDQDDDGIITRRDFQYFESIKYNSALMQELHHALKTKEG